MKKIMLLVIISLLVGMVSACSPAETVVPDESGEGGQDSSEADGDEKIVIRGLYQKQAGVQVDDMEALSAQYEELHPEIDLQWEYVAYEAIHDKVVTAAMAGTGSYDIVILDGIWPAEFAEAGFILDVTDKITDEMKEGIFPGALEEVMYKGSYWGYPS